MNKNKTMISLELLFLNDLLRTKVIDKDIYDKAVQKIANIKKTTHPTNPPMIMATA